jgi:hypothetical protein
MTYNLSYQMGEGGKTSTLKLAVPTALFSWSPPWIVGITGDSVHPDTEDLDAEVSLDAWITEIWDYLKDNILPDEYVSAERIICVAKRYMLVEGELYWRGANGNLMQCITQEDGCELLMEIHGGGCGNHTSSHTLVGKAFRHCFYWPIPLQDAV